MKTMEEELSNKNKELENTKTEMSKKLGGKQSDKSVNKHAESDINKGEEATADASTQVTSSTDKTIADKSKRIASLENKVLSKNVPSYVFSPIF